MRVLKGSRRAEFLLELWNSDNELETKEERMANSPS
jgi:hypothetical protein